MSKNVLLCNIYTIWCIDFTVCSTTHPLSVSQYSYYSAILGCMFILLPILQTIPTIYTPAQFAYFTSGDSNSVYRYELNTKKWDQLPPSPYCNSALAIIDGDLTAVGGEIKSCYENEVALPISYTTGVTHVIIVACLRMHKYLYVHLY